MTELLTNSRARCFRTCTRKHRYEYELGYRAAEPSHALWFGDLMHRGLQAYWESRRDGTDDPLGAALKAIPVDIDPFDAAKLRVMLTAYATIWDAIACEVLLIEEEFRLPLIHPKTDEESRVWMLAGKIDLMIRDEKGRVALVEHKGSSSDVGAGSDYRRRLTIDTQIGQYYLGAESLGYVPELTIYDILRKPAIKPHVATPIEDRKYTEAKSRVCKACKRKAPPPLPHVDEELGIECVDGRVITDPGGRLYANQREADETVEEFTARLVALVVEDPEAYIERAELHRFEADQSRYMLDIWKLSQHMTLVSTLGLDTMNDQSCFRYGDPCTFFAVCEGAARLDDVGRYRRLENVHEELGIAANAAK